MAKTETCLNVVAALNERMRVTSIDRVRVTDLCRDAGAQVTTAETAIFDLLHQAGTPAFKKVSALVR